MKIWRVGSRASRLAKIQTQWVIQRIQLPTKWVEIRTVGDRDATTPLHQMPEMGVFTKELDRALLEGKIDLAVHSLKDLPTQLPRGLCLAAVPERADPRDVWISHRWSSLEELPKNAIVATGSLRRKAQLLIVRPDLQIVPLRGNIDTRLRKLQEMGWDGMVLAGAGLVRAGYQDAICHWLTPSQFLPAPGQGALAVVARQEDVHLLRALEDIDHFPTRQAVEAERAFLSALGGGCKVPIAALATFHAEKGVLHLMGGVYTQDGSQHVLAEEWGVEARSLGSRLAQKLHALGAQKILATYSKSSSGGSED